jgi:hypothetical protein
VVTAETRPPRVGVALATSTSWEAPCTPVSTTSSSHCTSPSTSCWARGGDQVTHPGCRTPSWSAWPWPRSCSGSPRSGTGCASRPSGWGTCFRTCRPPRPTIGGCAAPRPWSAWPSTTWPSTPRPGGTSCAWWTPPRCRVRHRGRPSSAPRWPAMPATATARATTATSGGSGCTCWPAPTGFPSRGVWPAQAGRT